MRGNPYRIRYLRMNIRSIPASAGEPPTCPGQPPKITVYPRECGGTRHYRRDSHHVGGLSPRVRGNRVRDTLASIPLGSIPASAGEPITSTITGFASEVYPRECGGTLTTTLPSTITKGLSPRVRGNRPFSSQTHGRWRSIPASAGEPHTGSREFYRYPVYPRECGGTQWYDRRHERARGLSPRVRGNLVHYLHPIYSKRSIPASAGEPGDSVRASSEEKVYPRECGGTQAPLLDVNFFEGLSPRVRGNRLLVRPSSLCDGSIPASAGEPRGCVVRPRRWPVYPRECGGTSICRRRLASSSGLSPRVRGNLDVREVVEDVGGSIPASAGEPGDWPAADRTGEVYPRECGGTRLYRGHAAVP